MTILGRLAAVFAAAAGGLAHSPTSREPGTPRRLPPDDVGHMVDAEAKRERKRAARLAKKTGGAT